MKNTATQTTYFFTVSSLCIALFFILGCNGTGNESTFGSIAIPSPAPALPGTSNGLLSDLDYFYVGIDTTKDAIAHVHSDTDFSTPCGINKSSTSHEDITCLIEVPEADLYAKTLEMKFNVPANMCRYLVRRPYWFYNYEIGTGPKDVTIDIYNTYNGADEIISTVYTCTVDGVVFPGCSSAASELVFLSHEPTGVTYRCIYDNSNTNGANCCFGNKNVSTFITKDKLGVITTTDDTATSEWGGSFSSCIGGPGKTNWELFTDSGIPAWAVSFAKNGITDHQNVTAPLDLGIRSNIHVANYHDGTASSPVDHTHTGFIDNITTSTLPYYLDPIDDRNGTTTNEFSEKLFGSAQDSYEFQCLDEAFEIQHRIRVYVRDWDTYPDYLTFISSEGTTVIPDRSTDDEPSPTYCNSIPYAGYPCNDFHDTDDFLKVYLGLTNYNTTAGNITNRGSYFPRLGY